MELFNKLSSTVENKESYFLHMSHKFYTRYKNSGPRDCILLLRWVKVSVCLLASLLSGSELGGAARRSSGSTEKAGSGFPLGQSATRSGCEHYRSSARCAGKPLASQTGQPTCKRPPHPQPPPAR